jgi:hypothetical protein
MDAVNAAASIAPPILDKRRLAGGEARCAILFDTAAARHVTEFVCADGNPGALTAATALSG